MAMQEVAQPIGVTSVSPLVITLQGKLLNILQIALNIIITLVISFGKRKEHVDGKFQSEWS